MSRNIFFCATSYVKVQNAIERAAATLGLQHIPFRTHSFRRGAATALAMEGMPIADIMVLGRWASERSAKIYIQKGEVLLLRCLADMSEEQQQRIRFLVRLGPSVFDWSS